MELRSMFTNYHSRTNDFNSGNFLPLVLSAWLSLPHFSPVYSRLKLTLVDHSVVRNFECHFDAVQRAEKVIHISDDCTILCWSIVRFQEPAN